jgi:hypothetical protein
LELGDEVGVATGSEVSVEPALECRDAQLLEASRLERRERGLAEIRQRVPAPDRERLREYVSRRLLVARPRHEGVETLEIQLVALHVQEVARAAGLDPPGSEHAPEAVHSYLKRVRRRLGWIRPPEAVDQALARDDLVRVQQQEREERTLPRSPEREPLALSRNLQRAKQAESQASSVAGRRCHKRVVSGS